MKRVVSFCLYGSKNTYVLGMKENIILGKKYFPGWEIRIHYNNTVPDKYIKEYNDMGATCIKCKNIGVNKMNWEGMFWRWYPMDDKEVDIWLSRDADSRLSKREADIVNKWVKSDKTLHTIRDHRCHYNPIMGGLFGINNRLFHKKYKFDKISDIIKSLTSFYKERPYNVDQIFLNDKLWSLLKNDVMSHISNGGRRIYDTDIKIPSAANFIGKQYRLNDSSKLDYHNKNKGCYWKKSSESTVYWSNSSDDIRADIKFEKPDQYYAHRAKNGFPQNWSQISIVDGVTIKEKAIEEYKSQDNKVNTSAVDLSEYFDQIYIVHVNELVDRKISIINQIEKFQLKNVTIIDAINKNKINMEELKLQELVAYQGNNYCKTEIINDKGDKCWCNGKGHNDVCNYTGRVACALSHALVYKDIASKNYNRCLILEDDVVFNDNLNELFRNFYHDIPINWELIYFSNNKRHSSDYNSNFVSLSDGLCESCCYAITNDIARKLSENILPIRAASDGFLAVSISKLLLINKAYAYKKKLSTNGTLHNVFKTANDHADIDCITDYDTIKLNELDKLNDKLKKMVNCYNILNQNEYLKYFIPDRKNEILVSNAITTYEANGQGVNLLKKTNTNYKNVYILDSQEKRVNPIVKALFTDLLGGFKRLGFNVKTEIKTIHDIVDYSIIFVDNTITSEMINILYLKYKNCIFFGWCCHESKNSFDKLQFIFTTTETLTPVGKQRELVKNTINYCPLYHRCDEDPEKVGLLKKNNTYDWCYIGWKYRDDLIPNMFNGINKGVNSHQDYLTSSERREVYLSSLIHLAYVGNTNIRDGSTPQRVFEGLSYGCIVLTNSRPACDQTENIAEYVGSLKEVEQKIKYYLDNPQEVLKKQQLAYTYVKKCGTNHFTIEKLALKAKELFNVNFLENISKQDNVNDTEITNKPTALYGVEGENMNITDKSRYIRKDNLSIKQILNPLVSIAISTFESGGKGHELLKHNLDHILKQDYNNIEIVISDHSSDNKIKDLCEQYNGKKSSNGNTYPIKYIHNPEHKGNSSQNTNNAISHCRGEYIKILFMDDYLYNESAISNIVTQFQSNPDKKWLVHSYIHTKNYKDFYNLHHPKFSKDIVFCNRIGCPSCLTIHNSVKERFDEKLKWFMDSELYKRILDKYGKPIFLHTKEDEKPYMVNLHHAGQVTNTSIDKSLISAEKKYINEKKNDKTLMDLVDNTRTDKNTIHSFLPLYERLLRKKKYTATNVLEVGLGQRGSCHCGSVKLWRDYFINADVYAVEIYDKRFLWEGILNDARIKILTSTNAYDEIQFNEKILSKNIKFDMLLDDGSHKLIHMKQFIRLYSKLLKDDGILIIEDIPKIEWIDILSNEVPDNLKKYIKTYDLRKEKNRFDDIVFSIDLS